MGRSSRSKDLAVRRKVEKMKKSLMEKVQGRLTGTLQFSPPRTSILPAVASTSSAPSLLGPTPSLLGPGPQQTPNPLVPQPAIPLNLKADTFEQKVELINQILINPPPVGGIELALNRSGIRVSTDLVEEVLKKSYDCAAAALKFFQWAGLQLDNRHSPYAWNLLLDVLGKSKLFDAMWDAVKSMKNEGVLSKDTFASVFTCYALAEKANEAIMTFEVMEHYGCPQDMGAFNCLLCALCRYRLTAKASEFCKKMADKFPSDADTYAILLEGWEKEGDAAKAKTTLGDMVARLGWDPSNTAAYNAFLGTLCKGGQVDEALKFLHIMRSRNCYPDKSFFSTAIHALSLQNKADEASLIFEAMMRNGHFPSTTTYNSMISAYCFAGKMEDAYCLLDGMVFNGAFPDSVTYNTIFQALIKSRKVEEAASIFREMTKNEFDPDTDSYAMAIMKDLDMATMIWKHMTRKGIFPSMESATAFINSLCDNGRRTEAYMYVEKMMEKGIKVSDLILKKLKISYSEADKKDSVERASRKRKGDHH